MVNFIFFDNLIEFLNDLYELLKEDWKKFKLFINENKKNLLWLFIALITLQITDLISFGNSCNKYYKKQNAQLQHGGSTDPVVATPPAETKPSGTPEPTTAEPTKQTKIEIEKQKILDKKKAKLDKKKGTSESKQVQKNLDLFKKLKGQTSKIGQSGAAGPVFSNLEKIFDAVGGVFSIFVTLLTILGILSLPILIFIIITYCVVKKLLRHLALV